MGTKQKIGNEVTDRARVKVRFSSQFSFSHFSCPFSILITISFIYPSFNIYTLSIPNSVQLDLHHC